MNYVVCPYIQTSSLCLGAFLCSYGVKSDRGLGVDSDTPASPAQRRRSKEKIGPHVALFMLPPKAFYT